MIVNQERNNTPIGRKAEQLPALRVSLRQSLGRDPNHAELAQKLGVSESEIPLVEAAEATPYNQGGFRIYDISDMSNRGSSSTRRPAAWACTASPWTPTTLYHNRDAGLRQRHPRDLRHPQSGQARRSVALVDARPAPGRR